MILKGNTIKAGKVEGEAIVTTMPFSIVGDLDPLSGNVGATHNLAGQSIAGKIIVFPTGRGSTGGGIIAHYAKILGTTPAGMICVEAEPVIALVAIMNDIPAVDKLDRNPLEAIKTGDYIRLDATEGIVEVIEKGKA